MTSASAPLRGGDGSQGSMREIHLPVFDGPLDLLLRLIEHNDLDITAVSLVAVTDQYMAALRNNEGAAGLDHGALADFIAIGAKLIYLKSRALLPRPPIEPIEDDLEADDVGRELVELLEEYRRFSGIADVLQERQEAGLRLYTRLAPPPVRPESPGLENVTMDLMRKIMLDVLSRAPVAPRATLVRERITLTLRLSTLRDRLRREGRFSFRKAVEECASRLEVLLSFLAVLEMLKLGECDAEQDATWGDIEVVAVRVAA